MIVVRISKVVFVTAIAFLVSLVAFGNVTDYSTNWAFVKHVLSMDSIFPDSTIRYRAITRPELQTAAYWLIIGAELVTALLCWFGAFTLMLNLRAPASRFNSSKRWAFIGLTLGFVIWQTGFIAIGGEWFGMWQSTTWNGVDSAVRYQMTIIAVMVYLGLPDHDLNV